MTGRRRLTPLDAGVAVGLAVVAAYLRRDATPTDGLWYDDAWVAVGARARVADVFTVATNHPGFTLGLQALHRLHRDAVHVLTWPILVVGVLTPPLLHVVARRLGAGVVAAASGALLVAVSVPHATYSGRLKPYVVEAALVAVVALAAQRLSGRRWRWSVGLAWLGAMLVLASLGAFAFLAAALATLVLAASPAGDRAVRWTVLVVQGAVQLGVGLRLSRAYDSAQVAEDWETTYDGRIELVANPLELAGQVWQHLGRLGQALVDVPLHLAAGLVVVALAGLAVVSVRGPVRAAARVLLALPVVAFAGSLVGLIPFGPLPFDVVFPGGRASLWLLPSLVLGLAAAVELALRAAAPHRRVVGAAVAALAVAAALVGAPDPVDYGVLGTRSATTHVEAQRGPDGLVLLIDSVGFMVAAEPPVRFVVRAEPDSLQGFRVEVRSRRVPVPPAPEITDERIGALVGSRDRVVVHDPFVGFGDAARAPLAAALESLGFRRVSLERFGTNEVEVWLREA